MHDVPPLLFAAIRFTLVVLPAVFFVPRPSAPWRTVAAVGVFMSLGQFGLLVRRHGRGPAARPGGPRPAGAGDLHGRPRGRRAARAADPSAGRRASLLGVGRTRGGRRSAEVGTSRVAALTLCLLGALSWGIGNVVSRASGVSGGLSLTVWSAVVVPVPLVRALPGSSTARRPWSTRWPAFSLAGGASRRCTPPASPRWSATAIFNTLLSRNPSSSVVPWVLLAPVVAMASAWLLLDEVPTPAELLGGAVLDRRRAHRPAAHRS